jgi:hypothetical protein
MSKSDTEEVVMWIGVAAGFLFPFFIAGGYILHGWALSIVWGWFMVPLFSLPALSVPFAIGLILTRALVFPIRSPDTKNPGSAMALSFVSPLLAVLIGWVAKMFI